MSHQTKSFPARQGRVAVNTRRALIVLAVFFVGLAAHIPAYSEDDSIRLEQTEFCTGDSISGTLNLDTSGIGAELDFFLIAEALPGSRMVETPLTGVQVTFGRQANEFLFLVPEVPLGSLFSLQDRETIGNTFSLYFSYRTANVFCVSDTVQITILPRFEIELTADTSEVKRCAEDDSFLVLSATPKITPEAFADSELEYSLILDGRTELDGLQQPEFVIRNLPQRPASTIRYVIKAVSRDNNCVQDAEVGIEVTFVEALVIEFLREPFALYCPGEQVVASLSPLINGYDSIEWIDPRGEVIQELEGNLDFTIEEFQADDAGEYSVRAQSNGCWSEPLTFKVDVREETAIENALSTKSVYCPGDEVVIEYQISGDANGTRLLLRDLPVGEVSPSGAGRLVVTDTEDLTSGEYILEVTGPCNIARTPVSLNFLMPSEAILTSEPAGPNVAVDDGADFVMRVERAGPDESFQWLYNGNPIPRAIAAEYTFNSLNGSQSGNYSVKVTLGRDGTDCSSRELGPIAITVNNLQREPLRLAVPETILAELGQVFEIPVEILNPEAVNPQLIADLEFQFEIQMNATVAVPDAPLANGEIVDGQRMVEWSGSTAIPLGSELGRTQFTAVLGDAATADITITPILLSSAGEQIVAEPEQLQTVLQISGIPVDGRGNPVLLNPLRAGLELELSPNPISQGAQLTLEMANLADEPQARLQFFDVMGKQLFDLSELLQPGQTSLTLELSDYSEIVANRVYYVRLSQARRNVTRLLTVGP